MKLTSTRTPPDASDSPTASAVPGVIWRIVALAVLTRVIVAAYSAYTSEDFMITLRYAENLAAGHGMVYNYGQNVLGTTTPLYTLFLASCIVCHLPAIICGKLLNIAADGALCLLIYLWLRAAHTETAARVAAFLVAVHPLHLQWSISGMETGLVTCAGIWAWLTYTHRRYRQCALALGLLFLLRWDSLMLTAILTVAGLYRERRFALLPCAIFLAIVGPWIAVATWYYGNPIPITGQAKVTVYGWYADHLPEPIMRIETTGAGSGITELIKFEPAALLRRVPRQQKFLNYFLGWPSLLLTLAAAAGTFEIVRKGRSLLGPAVVWLIVYYVAFLASRVLLFHWYLLPPFPVFEALAAIGLVTAFQHLARRLAASYRSVLLAVGAAAAALTPSIVMAGVLRRSQQVEERLRAPIGLYLRRQSAPGDRILLEPIGYIGYYSQRTVIDVIGLVSPEALKAYTASADNPWLNLIREQKPEWCVLRPAEAAEIERASRSEGYSWASNYERVQTFSYSNTQSQAPLVFFVYRRR